MTPCPPFPPGAPARIALQELLESEDPVVGRLSRHERGVSGRMHSHPRAQLICAITTPAEIRCRSSRWTLRPGEAAWLPGDVEHSVSARRQQLFHSIYVRPDLAAALPVSGGVLPVSRFLGELISRLVDLYHGRGDTAVYPHLVPLVFSELGQAAKPGPDLPMPSDHRLRLVCQSLTDDPGNRRTLAEWAAVSGASRRLLERLFQSETGMGFTEWRQLRRARAATPLLEAGRPVQQVAWEMGYDSPSAFTAMFRKVMGVAPKALRPGVGGVSSR